jgi:hypothetical protein
VFRQLRTTADKKLRYASPKFAIANFFYPQAVKSNIFTALQVHTLSLFPKIFYTGTFA